VVSLPAVLARIDELRSALAPAAARTGGAQAPAGGAFASALSAASAAGPTVTAATAGMTPFGMPAAGGARAAIVAAARAEVGQAEQPPGSNDSGRIAEYRTATAGSTVAPWCGYFVSWLGRNAGAPIGDRGEGLGSVDAIYAWAQRTGRAVPAGQGAPQPGDLIVWDEHIGVVEAVLPDGRIQTIEGNSSNAVTRRVHARDGALGYVRMG
jgi:hypothetical protein